MHLFHVLTPQGIHQFEDIEFLAHTDMLCHKISLHYPFGLGKRNDKFVQFTGHTIEVSTDELGQHLGGSRFDAHLLALQIGIDPRRHLVVTEFGTLKENAHLFQQFHHHLAPIQHTVLVADNEHCRKLRLLEIGFEHFDVLHVLCLLDEDNQTFCPHREAHGRLHHGLKVDGAHRLPLDALLVTLKESDEIEVALFGFEQRGDDKFAHSIDVVALFTHQIVDGSYLSSTDITHDGLVGDARYRFLCHKIR